MGSKIDQERSKKTVQNLLEHPVVEAWHLTTIFLTKIGFESHLKFV